MNLPSRRKLLNSDNRETFEPVISPTSHGLDMMREEEVWNWAARFSLVGLFVIALGVILRLLEHIAIPLVLAWVIATVLLPVVQFLVRLRIPRSLSAVLLVVLLLIGVVTILVILTVPLSYWLSRADELGQLLKEKMALMQRPLQMLEELGRAITPDPGSEKPPVFVNAPKPNMISTMLSVLTPVVDEFMIFIIALVFNLIYQREIQNGIVLLVRDAEAKDLTRSLLGDVERNMSSYFGTVTVVNIFLGAATAGIAAVLGFPHPVLWGVLAGVANYVPYLGPVVVLGAFFVVGVVVFPTLGEAILAPLLFLALTTLEGQVITPAFIGHRLTINPFLVFVSIAFWTWMWGPMGAFLAVPLLVTGMVVMRYVSGSQGVAAQ